MPSRDWTRRLGPTGLLLALLVGACTLLLAQSGPSEAGPACTKSWASAVDGHWANPALWSPAGVPTAADDVCVTVTGTYTVLVSQSQVANSVQIGSTGAGTATVSVESQGCSFQSSLTVSTTAEVFTRGQLQLTSAGCAGTNTVVQTGGLTNDGTIDAAAANGGTRYLRGDVVNRGTVSVSAPVEFDTSGSVFDNQGTVTLANLLGARSGTTVISRSGAFTGSGSGRLSVSGGTFEQRAGQASGPTPVEILNSTLQGLGTGSPASFVLHQNSSMSGSIAVGQTVAVEAVGCSYGTTVTVAGALSNAGTLRLTSGGCAGSTAILDASGLITNTGTIDVAAANGGARYLRGSVRNQGSVVVDQPLTYDQAGSTFDNRASVTLTQPMTASGASFTNASGSVASSGLGQVRATATSTFTQGNGSTTGSPVEILNSALTFSPGSSGSSRFTAHQNSTLSGAVPVTATVTIEGVGCSYNTVVTASGAFTNAGTIRLSSGGCAGAYSMLSGPGLITNTGTIAVDPANGGARYLRADVRNQGTIRVDQPLQYDTAGTTLTNEGTVTLTQAMTATSATVRNLAGSIDGTGAGQLTVSASDFDQGNGDTSGNPVVVLNSDLAYLAPSTGTSAFVAHQNVGLSGNLPAGSTLTIEAVGCSYNTLVTAIGAFTNAGAIRFTSAGCAGAYSLLTGPGLITNTGTIDVEPGNGGDRYLRASVRNQGTITVDQPLTIDPAAGSTFTNEGTVTLSKPVAASNLTVRNLSGSIEATGTGQLTVSASTFEQGNGDTSGNPVVVLNSNLAYLAPSTGTSAFVAHQNVGLAGDLPSTTLLTIEAVGCSYNTQVTAVGAFTNAGTIRFTSAGCAGAYSLLTGPGLLTNTGAIDVEPGNGGARYLRASVLNQGTVTVDQPLTYDLTGGSTFTNEGTVTLSQPMNASSATVRNEVGSIDGSGPGVLTVADGELVQSGGDTTGNPIVTLRSDLTFGPPATGTSDVVMHQNGVLTGPVPAGASVAIEAIGCSYATAITAPAGLTSEGAITLTSGGCAGAGASLNVTGAFVNDGVVTSAPGTGGGRTLTAGSVENTGALHLQTGAPLTINGPLDVSATGTILVDVDGLGANGRMVVNGAVAFGGTLATNTTFVPPFGSTFQVATYGSSTGSFDDLGTTGTQYDATYGPTQLSISVLKVSSVLLGSTPAGPTVSGQAVTFTATVSPVAPDTGSPTGSVEFFDGSESLGAAPLDGTGEASLLVTDLAVGSRSITAEYLGAATFGRSTSSPVARVVAKASTATGLSSTPNPSAANEDVTFTATIAVVAPGAGVPTGTVTFKEGATVLGTAPVSGTGEAEFTTDALRVGSRSIVASYSGDARFGAATSAPVSQVVTGVAVGSTTGLSAPTTLIATQAFSLTAEVTLIGSGGTATGDVEFYDGARLLGAAQVRGDGTAVLRLPTGLGGGTHRMTARYLGTTTIDPSTSAELVRVIGRAKVSFAVTAELDPQKRGVVRFIVTASVAPPASAAPAGPVVLKEGNAVVGEGRLVDGRAVLTRCFIPACEDPPPTTTTTTSTSLPPTTTTSTTTTTTTVPVTTTTPRETTTTVEGATTTTSPTGPTTTIELPGTTVPLRPLRMAPPATAVPAVPVLAPLPPGSLGGLRAASTRQLVASYPGDDDFDSYDSDPIPVEVDGDNVSLPQIVPPTTSTTSTSSPNPPPPPPPTSTPVPTSSPLDGTTDTVPGGTDGTGGTIGGAGIVADPAGSDDTASPFVEDSGIDGSADPEGDGTADGTDADDEGGDDESAGGADTGAQGNPTGSGAQSGDGDGGDDRPQSLSSEFGRSTLSSSTASPKEISTDPIFILENVILTLFLLLFSVYPAYLINSTLAEHYDEVSGWFGPMHRRVERIRARQGTLSPTMVLGCSGVAGAILWCLLDPNIGWNMPTLALFVGLFCSAVIVSYVYDVARSRYVRRHWGVESSLRGYPLGVIIATILVLFSRMAGFTPGYLFGVFTALAFVVPIERRKDGKAIAVASLWILGVAVACWFLWVPVIEEASKPNAGFIPLMLDTTLATTWIVGIQTLVFGLMPLRFLDGAKVMAWSRVGWASIYALGMFAFVHSMVRPGSEVDGDTFSTAIVLFVAFTVVAVSFWGYFRFRSPRDPEAAAPPEGPEGKELVDA